MKSPADLALSDQSAFLEGALGGARRVLEVGAGKGALARALQAKGFDVTALDLVLPEKDEASGVRWIETDFLRFDSAPFDAVAFTSSLHHISPLDAAVQHAWRLLVPGGVLIADEFDLEAPDEATARWNYEVMELLIAAGSFDHDHSHSHAHAAHGRSPLARWRAEHEHHEAPLHTGRAMLEAIEGRFGRSQVVRRAYLYRYICARTSNMAVARHVKAVEERRIEDGSLRAVGLRIVARRG